MLEEFRPEVQLTHTVFVVSNTQANAEVGCVVGLTGVELWREVSAGDINLGVISTWFLKS